MHIRFAEAQQLVDEARALEIVHAEESKLPAHEKVALEFAELLITAPDQISDTLFADLRRHYTDSEVIEICWFILNYYKNHCFNTSVRIVPKDGENIVIEDLHGGKPKGGDPREVLRSPDVRFLA